MRGSSSFSEVAVRRLYAQRLLGEACGSAADAVAWLGAVQSQDYAGAKWALGLRTAGATDAAIDRLFDDGAILRTHVLRPTWHFVPPADVRWLLELTGPRVAARLALADRGLEIDQAVLARVYAVIESALGGGQHLTRDELAAALQRAGIAAAGQRLAHLAMHAELDAVVVSGSRRGRQHTYALLDERAPGAQRLDRDEALARLAGRYFVGHGPAQIQDFTWWSGLTAADAKRAIALNGPLLRHEVIGDRPYWSAADGPPAVARTPAVHLLPNYDELLVAYRDRGASFDPAGGLDMSSLPRGSILTNVVVTDGQVRGGWRRRQRGRDVDVELRPLDVLSEVEREGVMAAVERFSRFLGASSRVVEM